MSQPPAYDTEPERSPSGKAARGASLRPRANGFLLALQFLTVVPVRSRGANETESGELDMGRALPWFPLVGALLGVCVVAVNWALGPIFSRSLRDVIAIALPLFATGMLHFDGFVDCCDALLGSRSVERRLEILRDSRVGAYGVRGGALLLIARYAALGALAPGLWALSVVAALIVGRWAMVWVMTLFPYARAHGAASSFRSGPARLAVTSAMALALLGALAVFAPWGTPAGRVIVLAALGFLGLSVALLWALWARHKLDGGLTGDVYGATNELVELTILAFTPVFAQFVASIAW
jgi:adenosylcobinamide-GDP ribazoletransferase